MKHIQQRRKLDCGVACMAMLCKCEYEDVMGYFKQDFAVEDMDKEDLERAMDRHGWEMNVSEEFDPSQESIVIVPSLNNKGQEHAVCWSSGEVFDPLKGVYGKEWYTTDTFLKAQKVYQFKAFKKNVIENEKGHSCIVYRTRWNGYMHENCGCISCGNPPPYYYYSVSLEESLPPNKKYDHVD